MKSYNIAVCFSGEPRTWKHTAAAIKHFFSSDVHNYKFFGHTWNNSYFNKEHRSAINAVATFVKSSNSTVERSSHDIISWFEDYDKKTLADNLIDTFGMTDILVEAKTVITEAMLKDCLIDPNLNIDINRAKQANMRKPSGWSHLSYTKMRANALKTKYELENEMQFDVVVSARYDVCYPPESKFDQLLEYHGKLLPIAVYGETNYYPNEFFLPHINELLYFGNSRVMNIVDEFHRYYASGKFWEMSNEQFTDSSLKFCGYGPNLYRWLTMKNVLMVSKFHQYGVFRKTAEHLTWPQDWNEIVKVNSDLFT
jgi:hypothetical protein